MKLSADATIAPAKVRDYLLQWRAKDDKSRWLAQAGYTAQNWQVLMQDLRDQILPMEATWLEHSRYGDTYAIQGKLTGPNGTALAVRTIWMIELETGITKFITMYPDKRSR